MSKLEGQSDRIDAAVLEYYQRVDAGEDIDLPVFCQQYGDLADELYAFLQKDASLAGAIGESRTAHYSHTPRRTQSRGLQISCPHCSNHVELLVDSPFESVTCRSCGSSFSFVSPDEPTIHATPLKSIGRFDLVARLGVGGFGSVWKANDRQLDRTVAIKIPRKGQLSSDEIEQFFREARSAARLKHPNIVPVHEVGRDGETIFIVSEFVRGAELSDWLTAGRPHTRDVVALCRKVASAIHHAHEAGIIHRDIKPSNIMIDLDGEPHVMDFGLAKRDIGEITMTVDGQILGTPAYMSPEQAAGRSHWTDRRTDVYSLGVVLYRLLTGELPFRGNAQMQVLQRLKEDPPAPRKLNRHIPRDLDTICMKCLERDPNRRYQTALALAEEFDRFLAGEPIVARPLSRPARAMRWARRKPAIAALLAAISILAVGGPIVAIEFNRQRAIADNALTEKSALVKRLERQTGEAQTHLTELQRQLAVWEGRATLHDAWFPDPLMQPHRELLASLLQQRGRQLASVAGNESRRDAAQRQMALATLHDGANNREGAIRSFVEASKSIQELLLVQPDDARLQLGLAQCYERLADLTAKSSAEESKSWLAKELEIRRQMATVHSDDPIAQSLRMNAEVRADVVNGFDEEGATTLEKIGSRVDTLWPTQPSAIYRVACFLAGRTPWLVEDAGDAVPFSMDASD